MNNSQRDPKTLHTSILIPFAVLGLGLTLTALLAAQIPGPPAALPAWTPRPLPTETATPTPDWWEALPTGTPILPGLPAVPTVTLGQSGQTGSQGPVAFQVESCPGAEARITAITASGVWWLVDGRAAVDPFWYWKMELSPDGNGWTQLYRSETPVAGGRLMEFNISTVPKGSYRLKLTAVYRDGNYPPPCIVQVNT